jgi:peptidoglycan hydrolase-like protein with peptidoglycan-binding domain
MDPEERAAVHAALNAPLPTSELAVYAPGHLHARIETGKTTPVAIITYRGEIVGFFGPETLKAIAAFWREHGVDV